MEECISGIVAIFAGFIMYSVEPNWLMAIVGWMIVFVVMEIAQYQIKKHIDN